jgi:uncharacterized protein with NRDE domain
MCILMIVYQLIKGVPILIAANRDEHFDRPTEGPCLLTQAPQTWGGRDKRNGGTWLGINANGLLIGLTNRRVNEGSAHDPSRPSRGLLCLAALQCNNPSEVITLLAKEPLNRYNSFNLLIADQQEALWIAYEGSPKVRRLDPGIHILANGNLNDLETARIHRARLLLQQNIDICFQTLLSHLERVCMDHESGVDARETICMHRSTENYGTVSSTIIALTPDFQGSVYRYAEGPPCSTPYKDYPLPFSHAL